MAHSVDIGVSPFSPLLREKRTWAALRHGRRSLVRLLGFDDGERKRFALQNRIFERHAFRVELLEPVVCDTAVNEDFQVLGVAVACEHWGWSHDKIKGT